MTSNQVIAGQGEGGTLTSTTEKRLQRRLERCARELESIRLEAESEGIAHGATWRMSYMGELSLLSFQADENRPTPTAISVNILTAFVSDIY